VNLFGAGMVHVDGSKIPKMVRHSGDGNRSARGHGRRERERHGTVVLTMIVILEMMKMINSPRIGKGRKTPT